MTKHVYLLFCTVLVISLSACKSSPTFEVADTYVEPEDPAPLENQEWKNVSDGLHLTIAPTDIRFVPSVFPTFARETQWQNTVWKGERSALQLALWSKDSLTKVRVRVSDFKADNGATLPSSLAQVHFAKYVLTDVFGEGCGYRKPEDFPSSLAADALDPVDTYALEAQRVRPVWIILDTPADAAAGEYQAKVTVEAEGQKPQEISLSLNIINQTLPEPKDWVFHLDLWQNPYAVARFHNVKPWSGKHWELLRPIMKRLADAGQKVITASINTRPWGGQTFDPFGSMIEWRKQEDGSWTYDYTVFDAWVEMMMELGVKDQISCYSMVPWGNQYHYFDEATAQDMEVTAAPGTDDYAALWTPFLIQFKAHLEEKGWDKITRIAMDERNPQEMKAMLDILNQHAPELGVSFADNHKSYKLYPNDLKDMSAAFSLPVPPQDLEERRSRGLISTQYVCCTDEFPNTFTFSAPAEATFIGWYSIAAGYDGFLRWAYNSWTEHPLTDSRFRAWPAGDTYIVYPGNRSSIRFEKLREGIQDAEKIRILREALTQRKRLDELDHLNQVVAQFNVQQKPKNLEALLSDARHTLNKLAESLD